MSEGTLQAVIPALIALLGTLLTVYIGVWQWRKQTRAEKTSAFSGDKQAAYKGLWEKLEEVHVKLRVNNLDPTQYKALVQDVNGYILKHSLYLDPQDQSLANQYLSKLNEFSLYVTTSENKNLKESWEITGALPPDVVAGAKVLSEIEGIRSQILDKCRKVVSGQG